MKKLPTPRKHFSKRALALFLAGITVLALAVPAFACGHGHHSGKRQQTQVSVCSVEDCETVGRHIHNGVTYCGYAHEDGVCDGKCLALCSVEGCTAAGRHTHSGIAYCGNHHESGFCTGSCSASSTARGHHSGRHH